MAQDDFSTYPPAVWADGTVVGPWSQAYGGDGGAQIVVDGAPVLLLATPLTTPTRAALALRAQVDAGIDFAVKMKVVGLVGSPSEVRVYWSYQGSSHLYALALDGQSWSLFEELAGSTKVPVLTQQGPLIPTGSWHTVGVLQRDDSATVFVDGVARGNAQFDAGYTGGQLGFYVQQAQSELATVVLAAP